VKTYTILHTHQFGSTHYVFQSERTDVPLGWHGEDCERDDSPLWSLCACLDIDFEPEREESLDITELEAGPYPVWS